MKLKYVDVLRGLAILGVLVVHCSQWGNNGYLPTPIYYLLAGGATGVQLFYIASAFTLFLSMSKRYENETYPKSNFFIRRFFRIAPMYYIGIVYYLWQDGFGAKYWLGDASSITVPNILSNFFFVHGFNPYWITSIVPGGWSIAVEMLFYCLVPLLFIKIKNTQQAFIFLIITLIFRVILHLFLLKFQLITSERLWNEYLFFYLPSQLPVFALGILFYFIIKDNYKFSISPILFIIPLFIIICQLFGIPILPRHFLISIAFVVFGLALSKFQFKILVNPVLEHIGKVSYSMYLVHFAVLYWLNKFNLVNYIHVSDTISSLLNYGIRLLIVIIVTVLISTLFYNFVEVPMQNVGKKLITELNTK